MLDQTQQCPSDTERYHETKATWGYVPGEAIFTSLLRVFKRVVIG